MKKVVLIGGGHGLSNLVKGFKKEDVDLTVVVSSTDDGGHTGKLRNEFDIIAVGDLRMVLSELIEDNSALKEFFNYRFDSLHETEGVSLGNLIITSLLLKHKDIDEVIKFFKDKEDINSNVFMASNNSLALCAESREGNIIKGECKIGQNNIDIEKLYVENQSICNNLMLKKIEEADIIVLAPGSLYTSVGAVLCVDDIKKAIHKSLANIVYVCNIMTQDGETKEYSVKNHEETISSIMNKKIDRVIVNKGVIDDVILKKYKEENSVPVECNEIKDYYEFYELVEICDNKVRHNSLLTAKIILSKDRQNKNMVI